MTNTRDLRMPDGSRLMSSEANYPSIMFVSNLKLDSCDCCHCAATKRISVNRSEVMMTVFLACDKHAAIAQADLNRFIQMAEKFEGINNAS